MPQTCAICTSLQRAAIEAEILRGAPMRGIAAQFGEKFSKDAVLRHRAHISTSALSAHEAQGMARADDIVEQMRQLTSEAHRLKALAEKGKDWRAALMGVREVCRIAELVAKLSGALAPAPRVTINIGSPAEGLREATELMLLLADRPTLDRVIAQLQARARELDSCPLVLIGQGGPEDMVSTAPSGALLTNES